MPDMSDAAELQAGGGRADAAKSSAGCIAAAAGGCLDLRIHAACS